MKVKETYLVRYYGIGCELYLTETEKWMLNKPYHDGNGGHYSVMSEITKKEAKEYIKKGL